LKTTRNSIEKDYYESLRNNLSSMYLNGYNSTINSAVAFEGKTASKKVEYNNTIQSSTVTFVDYTQHKLTDNRRIDTHIREKMPKSQTQTQTNSALQKDAERQDK